MNPFTTLKNLLPFYITSLHFTSRHFFLLILSTLHFTLICYSYLQLISLNFISLHFLSPSTLSKFMHVTNQNSWNNLSSERLLKWFWGRIILTCYTICILKCNIYVPNVLRCFLRPQRTQYISATETNRLICTWPQQVFGVSHRKP